MYRRLRQGPSCSLTIRVCLREGSPVPRSLALLVAIVQTLCELQVNVRVLAQELLEVVARKQLREAAHHQGFKDLASILHVEGVSGDVRQYLYQSFLHHVFLQRCWLLLFRGCGHRVRPNFGDEVAGALLETVLVEDDREVNCELAVLKRPRDIARRDFAGVNVAQELFECVGLIVVKLNDLLSCFLRKTLALTCACRV